MEINKPKINKDGNLEIKIVLDKFDVRSIVGDKFEIMTEEILKSVVEGVNFFIELINANRT